MKSSLTVKSHTGECEKIFDFLLKFSRNHDIEEDTLNDLKLIIEETFTNIASYAYEDDGSSVDITLRRKTDTISITFIDSGIAFNPITDCDRDIELSDHCDGGMGIHIIKSLVDELDYERIDQKNVFTVTKHYTNHQQ